MSFAKAGHGVCVVPSRTLGVDVSESRKNVSQKDEASKPADGIETRAIKVIANKTRKADKPYLRGTKFDFFESLIALGTDE